MSRSRRVARWVALVLIAAVVLAAINLGAIVDRAMTPDLAFAAETPPPAPDYAMSASWSALPERVDFADQAPSGSAAVDPRRAPADVFYVHPTSYVGDRWNAPTTDASLNAATDRVATGIQASVFNGCCAVYAPRYRQANGSAFYRRSVDGDRAIELAYGDVRRAFDAFNARRGGARPFIIAAHSQGSVLAERLLYEAVSGTPLRGQLVVAYLPGGGVTTAGLRERAPDLAPCRAADDLRCVAAWDARSPAFAPTRFDLRRADTRERLCTNPLTWTTDGARAPESLNLGAVFMETDDHAPRAAFADARCARGRLVVTHIGRAPRDLPSRVLDRVLGAGNYHPIEYQIFFMNLRRNAAARVSAFAAWIDGHAPAIPAARRAPDP
jgi:hypothetical protein